MILFSIYYRYLAEMFSSMRLSPTTVLGKEQAKKIKTIIQSIMDKPQSYDFQNPVDWKGMGLTDYTFIIKNPMDLNTVSEKLKADKYRFVEEPLDDIQLIWDNCKTYNHPETWIYKIAQNLERNFKKMVKNYLPSIPITVPGRQTGSGRNDEKKPVQNNMFQEQDDEEVPYHQKMKFQEKLKHLSAEDLGHVVDVIMKKCPDAFKEEDNDNAQLHLDNIDAASFEEINEIVNQLNEEYEERQLSKKVKQ